MKEEITRIINEAVMKIIGDKVPQEHYLETVKDVYTISKNVAGEIINEINKSNADENDS